MAVLSTSALYSIHILTILAILTKLVYSGWYLEIGTFCHGMQIVGIMASYLQQNKALFMVTLIWPSPHPIYISSRLYTS